MPALKLEGRRFGKLVVRERAANYVSPKGANQSRWVCICDCGEPTLVLGNHLMKSNTTSCGCSSSRNAIGSKSVTHGHSVGRKVTREYKSYSKMLERCLSPACEDYPDYGGRGITVCDRWNPIMGGSFQNFFDDMGKRPPNTSIGRIENDAGYAPENCEWQTPKQQANNKRPRSR